MFSLPNCLSVSIVSIMSALFIIPLVLMSLVSSPSWGETRDDLVIRAGLYYKKFTATPFTGELEGQWKGSIKNGKEEGFWEYYDKNGQLFRKGDFKNGKRKGSWETYYEGGQLWYKGDYKNGKREGSFESYNEDGTVDAPWTGTWKNDVKISN